MPKRGQTTQAAHGEERLAAYQAMRDFNRTPEPSGSGLPPGSTPLPRFVIQEHHARALHWDFRLERDGVLVSWAIPRGLPVDPKSNHLAVHTEDHPIEYATFAGEIPAGSYGAGTVTLWDTGTYECEKFRDQEVMVTLHGQRVQGKYVLFCTEGKDWMIHRMDPPQDPTREPMPDTVEPMLAMLSELPRDDARYAFEIKWDGIRAILFASGGRVRLQSRNLLDITPQYPELRALGLALGASEAILDGEIVSFDSEGRPSFQQLQYRMNLTRSGDIQRRAASNPATYMVFDLLYFDGHSTMGLAYSERRRLLEALDLSGSHWKTPPYHTGDGAAMLDASRAQGLEGVVAKRLDGTYQPGRRSAAWLKIKNSRSQELVIGGWTPGEGTRESTLGALLVGYYDLPTPGQPRRLAFAGRVGTGFTEALLAQLLRSLEHLRSGESPFIPDPRIPPEARFVAPRLVCEVAFTEWTRDRTLRHPVFKGLRDDKDPAEVVLETPLRADGA
jgi:bifunctional non-homologous end joining protein LigD